MQVQDHIGIYQTPLGSDCIKWSQDNLLAVAAGQSVTIFSPAALGGPRAFAPYRSIDTSVVAPGFTPTEWLDSPQFAMSAFYEVNMKNAINDQGWLNIAWSPVGCTVSGGCYLAALSGDFKVRVLAPPAQAMSSSWHEVVDVTKLFQDTMAAASWEEVDCLAVGAEQPPAEAGGALRLRGGCSRPGPFGSGLVVRAAGPAAAAALAEAAAAGVSSEPDATDAVLRLRGGGRGKRSGSGTRAAAPAPRAAGAGAAGGAAAADAAGGAGGAAELGEAGPERMQTEEGSTAVNGGVTAAATATARGKVVTAVAARLGNSPSSAAQEQPGGGRRSPRLAPSAPSAAAGSAAPSVAAGSAAARAPAGKGDGRRGKASRVGAADPAEADLDMGGDAEERAVAGKPPPAKRLRRTKVAAAEAAKPVSGPVEASDTAADANAAPAMQAAAVTSPDQPSPTAQDGVAAGTASGALDGTGACTAVAAGEAGWGRAAKARGPSPGAVHCGWGAAAAPPQLCEGARVEVHNEEEGLMGAWFPGRLIRLSSPQYGYGLVQYDELQVSEEAGAPMLTEWFPLPDCPRLLSPAAARGKLPTGPDGSAYPVHSRRGYAVRPRPPKEVATSPLQPPLRLGMPAEILHDAAWWPVKVVEITGPPDAVAAAATGSGVAAGSSGGSGVVLHVQLLGGCETIAVPLERSRSPAAWDARTGAWSTPASRDIAGAAALPVRPAHWRDVVLLAGGGAAAAVLAPLLAERVEELRDGRGAAEPEGVSKAGGEAPSWASAVEAAGREMLRAFAPEFELLELDGLWLWAAARGRLAALQGASHPDQLTRPAWANGSGGSGDATAAAIIKQEPQTASGSPGRAGGSPAARDGPESSGGPLKAEPEAGSGGRSGRRGPGRESAGGSGAAAAAGTGAGSAPAAATAEGEAAAGRSLRKPAGRRSRLSGAVADDVVDYSGVDPDTFRQYDRRPEADRDAGGAGLEKAARGMIVKRFTALLSAVDPATLHVYVLNERMTGIELQLYERAYGEFMHLYGDKLPEGADKRINMATKQRCRQLVRKADAGAGAGAADADDEAEAEDEAADVAVAAAGEGAAKRRRTAGADGAGRAGRQGAGGAAKRTAAAAAAAAAAAVKEEAGEEQNEQQQDEEEAEAVAAAGEAPARWRKSAHATATPGSAADAGKAGSARKAPAARRSRGAAADGVPPADFSGTDPDTFRQYDTRRNQAEVGAALERAAPNMILGRCLALFAAADPATFRTYKPGEHMTGAELKLYEQACGEFMHLYDKDLPEGAPKRIQVEAKRRVRQHLRVRQVSAAADATPAPHGGATAAAGWTADGDAAGSEPGTSQPKGSAQAGEGEGEGGAAAGRTPATNASGRKARAAAVRAAAAARRQIGGAAADASSSEDKSDKEVEGEEGSGGSEEDEAAGKGRQGQLGRRASAPPSAAAARGLKRGRAERAAAAAGTMKKEEEDEGDDDTSSFTVGDDAEEESGDSSGDESLGDDEEEAEEGQSGGEEDGDDEEAVDEVEGEARPWRGRSRGRGGGGRGGGRGRGRGDGVGGCRPSSKQEEKAAVEATAAAVASASKEIFKSLAPSVNMDDAGMLMKHGGSLVFKRYIELRGKYDPAELPSYTRGEHLRGADSIAFTQAYGEFMKLFGGMLPAGADKRIKTTTKTTIRRVVIQSFKDDAGTAAGTHRGTAAQLPTWAIKKRQGVREAAGVQGTLCMGYGEGGEREAADEEAARGGSPGAETAPGLEEQEYGGAAAAKETWETTLSAWGRRTKLRYRVELNRGSAPDGPSSASAAAASGTGRSTRCDRLPSYAIRFFGNMRDDHRDLSLEDCPGSDVGTGPPVATPAYEARSLAMSATCLAWSPTCCAAAAAAAAAPAAVAAPAGGSGTDDSAPAAVTTAVQSDGVARYCVLAVGNKLGQVAMWRLGLPSSYEHRPQGGGGSGGADAAGEAAGARSGAGAAAGPGPGSRSGQLGKRGGGSGGGGSRTPAAASGDGGTAVAGGSRSLLQWMGALRVHRSGAHVLRLVWCVAPEGASGTAAAAASAAVAGAGTQRGGAEATVAAAAAEGSGQWRVPQPHSAGPRDSLLLLTGLSDGSVLLWSAPAATFSGATDLSLMCEICPPDGLAPTALDCTWLLEECAAGGGDGSGGSPAAAAAARSTGGLAAPGPGDDGMEVDAANDGGGAVASRADDEQGEEEAEEDDEGGYIGATGLWARRLLVAASKPCGAVFVWRSGSWRPRMVGSLGAKAEPAAAAAGAKGDAAAAACCYDLMAACSGGGGAASCLQPGAHGTYHCSGVAVAAGRPLIVSGGVDGAVRCWTVSELQIPPAAAAALQPQRRPLAALHLTEVPDGMHRLDPCSAALPELPTQVRSLPLSRQAVHGVAASGNGLLFAVLRTTSTRQLDMARNVMIHGRVLGGTVHLMTPYSMAPASAAPLLRPPPPRLLAAGLLFQAPVASCVWDVHAMALRAGLVAAAMVPPVPSDAWDSPRDDAATAADDAAALEQVQGTEEAGGADDGGAAAGGNMDLGRARLAALVRLDAEERRRSRLTARLSQLTATKLMLAATERFVAPLEASYKAAAAADAAVSDAPRASLYSSLAGSCAWAWCGLRIATALRRMALSHAASRADPPGAALHEQLADMDAGVLEALRQAGGAAAAAVSAPSAVMSCRDAAARNEVELLQAHVWATLSYGIQYCMRSPPAAGAAAAARPPLHQLLMADWVTLHLRHPALREEELLPLTVRVYLAADERPPLDGPPRARETLSLSPQPVPLTGVDMLPSASVVECTLGEGDTAEQQQGQQQQQLQQADSGPSGAGAAGAAAAQRVVLALPRCGATMALCESTRVWNCVVCFRRYLLPPTLQAQQSASPTTPYCLFCGVRLGKGAGGDNFLRQPSLPAAGDVALPI